MPYGNEFRCKKIKNGNDVCFTIPEKQEYYASNSPNREIRRGSRNFRQGVQPFEKIWTSRRRGNPLKLEVIRIFQIFTLYMIHIYEKIIKIR